MEKYARQALSEGCKSAEDLSVTIESELYRVLNLHYNRNNHIEVSSAPGFCTQFGPRLFGLLTKPRGILDDRMNNKLCWQWKAWCWLEQGHFYRDLSEEGREGGGKGPQSKLFNLLLHGPLSSARP